MHSDSQLVRQVLGGNRQAYAELVDRYQSLVRGVALRLTRDAHLAEDVAQEVFVSAFQQLASLRDPEKFASWAVAIAKRTAARSHARRLRAAAPLGAALAADAPAPLSDASRGLLELVERLPAHEQTVVALRYLSGHSVQEIAAIAGRPVGTVTKQLSRACERLRTWLEQESAR
jgi:RNA polymerase sigma-70 factor (ECF subfamily)